MARDPRSIPCVDEQQSPLRDVAGVSVGAKPPQLPLNMAVRRKRRRRTSAVRPHRKWTNGNGSISIPPTTL